MHPAQSRRLRREKVEAERGTMPVHRHGRYIGTVVPATDPKKWLARGADGDLIGGTFATVGSAEARIIARARFKELGR